MKARTASEFEQLPNVQSQSPTGWNAKLVKELLPNVEVKIGNKLHTGRVTGRANKYATVTVQNEGTLHSGTVPWVDFHFSWTTIADALNKKTALLT